MGLNTFFVIVKVGPLRKEFKKKEQNYYQKQPPEVFYKKGVLKTFAKLTGKQLCQSLFLNKVAG